MSFFNPLVGDLSKMTDHEFQEKHSDLQRKYSQVLRIGPGALIPQLQSILAMYDEETKRRNAGQMEEMRKQIEKRGKSMDKLINIK